MITLEAIHRLHHMMDYLSKYKCSPFKPKFIFCILFWNCKRLYPQKLPVKLCLKLFLNAVSHSLPLEQCITCMAFIIARQTYLFHKRNVTKQTLKVWCRQIFTFKIFCCKRYAKFFTHRDNHICCWKQVVSYNISNTSGFCYLDHNKKDFISIHWDFKLQTDT